MDINSISDFRRAIRNGAYAWPGGYPLYFITSDGAALSFAAAKAEKRNVLWAIANKVDDGWRVVAVDVNYEDADLTCDHTGERIESAYGGQDGEVDLTGAELYADSNRGVYIPQYFAQSIKRELVANVSDEEYATLESGPDHEWYWDTWSNVLDRAIITDPARGECSLWQDGDLWIVPNKP